MSQIPNMLESTIQKIREMVDVNSVIGEPISTPDGVTIIPVSKVSVGFGGGGADFTKKTAAGDNPFGGGVGGGVIEALARGGVGSIDIIDGDTVSITNLNRQILATHATLGRSKTDAARERILSINPSAKVCTYPLLFTP